MELNKANAICFVDGLVDWLASNRYDVIDDIEEEYGFSVDEAMNLLREECL